MIFLTCASQVVRITGMTQFNFLTHFFKINSLALLSHATDLLPSFRVLEIFYPFVSCHHQSLPSGYCSRD
jgi:hypothetical protein